METGFINLFHGFEVALDPHNLLWCFVKNMPFPLVVPLLPGQIALMFYELAVFTRLGLGREIVAAKWHALLGLSGALRKRREVQAGRRATCRDIWRIIDHRCWRTPLPRKSR